MKYIPEIDGLRALAVLLVFAFHLDPILAPGGFIGVDLFFVISGFLISKIIITQVQEGRFSFLNFYNRRVRRIFPALFFLLFATSLMALICLGGSDSEDFFKALRYASAQGSNFLFSQQVDYFQKGHQHSALLHTWSLGVEEQFYLLWPLLIFWSFKTKIKNSLPLLFGLVFIASIIACIFLTESDPMKAFYMLPTRAWQLATGGIIALGLFPKQLSSGLNNFLSLLGLVFAVGSGYLITQDMPYPGWVAIFPTIGGGLLVYCAQLQTRSSLLALFKLKPILFVGKISYSLYLWHWPFIAFTKNYTQEALSPLAMMLIIAISFVSAYLSWKYIETPFRKSNEFNSKSSFLHKAKPLLIGLSLVVIGVFWGNGLKSLSHNPYRLTPMDTIRENMNIQEFSQIEQPEGCNAHYNETSGEQIIPPDSCVYGPNKFEYEVLLFGDSHSSHYTFAVVDWAKRNNLSVKVLSSSACPTFLTEFQMYFIGKLNKSCEVFVKKVLNIIKKRKHIKYVLMAMRTSNYTQTIESDESHARTFLTDNIDQTWSLGNSRRVFNKSLEETIEILQKLGKTPVLLGQVPILAMSPQQCLENMGVPLAKLFPQSADRCFILDQEFVKSRMSYARKTMKEYANKYNITYFDPHPYLPQPRLEDGTVLYYDDDHLNETGSKHLGPSLVF